MRSVAIKFHAPLAHVVPRIGHASVVVAPAVTHDSPSPAVAGDVKHASQPQKPIVKEPTLPVATPEPSGPTVEQLLVQIATAMDSIKEQENRVGEEFYRLAAELAVIVAAKLTHDKVEQDQFRIDALIGEMLTEFGSAEPLRIRLHPKDYEVLENRIRTISPPWSAQHEIQFVTDPALPRGSCQVDAESYGLITDLATRIEILRHRILDGMEHARIERRKNATGGAGVQRFPERRQTS